MLAADWLARFLASQGVDHVFEVVGGMIAHLIDAIHRDGRIRLVSAHHEQAAGFAAEGHARMTGVPGVAMATSGPGATNLLTAIGSCYFDSTPAVFITGQVNRAERKGERPIRQLGFQEADITAMAKPLTKAAWYVEEPEQFADLLASAFALSRAGRPGPVLLDVPMDVQRAELEAPPPEPLDPQPEVPAAAPDVGRILDDLSRAHRPLLLVGGGIRSAGAVEELRALVDALQVPVVNSLMGVDVLPWAHPLRVGMIGTYGNRWANVALGLADCLLVLGSRLDIRQTGADVEAFKGDRPIHHVDCDPGEINNRVRGCQGVESDLRPFLAVAAAEARRREPCHAEAWREELAAHRREWPDTAELRGIDGINPNWLMHEVSRSAPCAAYVCDVGQHQMWAAQSLELTADQRFITSGGMGAMGSGLPLAIGTAYAAPGSPVTLIAGDGGFQLNLQELQTVVRGELPLKVVLLNNGCHGMVRQFQDTYFEGRYQSTMWGYSAPDFAAVARAFGLATEKTSDPADVPEALRRLWSDPSEPFLLEVAIDSRANAYPKIAFGHPITEMEPFADPIGMEAT